MKRMKKLLGLMALGFGEILFGAVAIGQTVERDTTITGPRGRTINRQVEVQRGPNGIERSIQIQRPGGTFDRQVQLQRAPGWRPPVGGPWPRPAWFPRPVLVGASAPAFGFGLMAAADAKLFVRRRGRHRRWTRRGWAGARRTGCQPAATTRSGGADDSSPAKLHLQPPQGRRLYPGTTARPARRSIPGACPQIRFVEGRSRCRGDCTG